MKGKGKVWAAVFLSIFVSMLKSRIVKGEPNVPTLSQYLYLDGIV